LISSRTRCNKINVRIKYEKKIERNSNDKIKKKRDATGG
jgi:hypothetical protein